MPFKDLIFLTVITIKSSLNHRSYIFIFCFHFDNKYLPLSFVKIEVYHFMDKQGKTGIPTGNFCFILVYLARVRAFFMGRTTRSNRCSVHSPYTLLYTHYAIRTTLYALLNPIIYKTIS